MIRVMASYAARYERGEYDEVWRELRAMGPKAVDSRHREDSEAVVHTMAVRARHNVDVLVSRLSEAGFDFRSNDDERLDRPAHIPPTDDAAVLVDWMEQAFGPIPLTVAAWIRQVGDVWLVGDHPDWPGSDLADPLVVEFEYSAYPGSEVRDHYKDEHDEWLEARNYDKELTFQIYFAPDDLHKANTSGGEPYGIQVPDTAVDGLCVTSDQYFVDYLNAAFAAGGFPGALIAEGYQEPPPGLRENLTKDLLRL